MMLFSSGVAAVAALSAAGSAYAVPHIARPWDHRIAHIQRAQLAEGLSNPLRPYATTLKPISVQDFEAAFGMEKRDLTELDHMVPGNQAHMVFGSPGSKLEDLLHISK
jgi:hypothetical protein